MTPLLLLALSAVALAQTGDTLGVHDPCIAVEKGTYYVYSTGRGLPIRASKDLFTWAKAGRVFEAVPAWAKEKIPRTTALWAPDLSYFNNEWHLYYAASSFGSDTSVIGLATNKTLDPQSPGYRWEDQGLVIESKPKGGWNAIDPALALDETGKPYLFFGSFWGGIKAIAIDAKTGKPAEAEPKLVSVAGRPDTKSRAIEAAFVFRHDGYYYLFASFDLCCQGINSSYTIVVGRSKEILGPYVDMDGKGMTEGGGTLVLAGYALMHGPGHNAVLHDEGTNADYLVHHIYDMNNSGQPVLQVRPIIWEDGWPLPGEPLSGPASVRKNWDLASVAGAWQHYAGANPNPSVIHLTADGKITESPDATWSLAQNGVTATLTLAWPKLHSVDTVLLAGDGQTYVGRSEAHVLIRGHRAVSD
jgi:arabinan endo-1,5-alpha-L-arabinosidase